MSNILTLNQLHEKTDDGRYTQQDLINRIKKVVASKGYDNGTTQSVINSFVQNGILETYNELGFQKWMELIHQIVDHEGKERRM